MNINTDSLSFLGSGYPLYFSFLRSSIVLLVMCLVSVGELSLVTNNNANDC